MLHELSGEEVTDTKHDDFLADAFVLPTDSTVEEDLTCETMDVVRDRPHKSEELSNEVMSFITNPKNKKSAKTHSRH